MSAEPASSAAEYLQWTVTVLTAIGLLGQHIWSRRSLVTHRDQDQFDKHIADPARALIAQIDAFAASIPQIKTGAPPNVNLMSLHAVLVRAVNTFVRDCVDSPIGGGNDWYGISTKQIEVAISTDSDENVTALQTKTLLSSLERLKAKIQTSVRDTRPK